MSWKRLATYALGGAMCAVAVLVPATAPILMPAGVGVVGLATQWPGDKKKIRRLEATVARNSPTITPAAARE